MKRPRAVPLRRLAPVAILVVLVHAGLLLMEPAPVVRPAEREVRSFETRTVAQAPAPLPEPAPVPAPAAPPVPAAARAAPAAPPPAPKPPARAERVPAPPAAQPAILAASLPLPAAAVASAPLAAPAVAGLSATAAPVASASEAAAVALPPSARFRYELSASYKGLPLQGEADLHWRHDGKQYEAVLELRGRLLPTRSQRSTGLVTPQGLAPTYFLDKSRREQAAHFERDKGRIVFSNNAPSAPIVPGIQDRLSVLLQLAALIGGAPDKYPPGTQIAIQTVSRSDSEPWTFSVEREEDLQLPGGTLRAVKLQRLPRKEFDQKVELWLAPRLDYAPVRLRLTNPGGDTVDQRWSSTDKG
jgi:hypothetical protein